MDFFAYLAFILIIIIFYILFTLGSKINTPAQAIQSQVAYSELDMALLNILRTHDINNNDLADLIAIGVEVNEAKQSQSWSQWLYDRYQNMPSWNPLQDFEVIATPALEEFVSSNYNNFTCWKLTVIRSGNEHSSVLGKKCGPSETGPQQATVEIPGLDPSKQPIDVTLTVYLGTPEGITR
jgi:hypothetical protein